LANKYGCYAMAQYKLGKKTSQETMGN